MAYAFNDDKSKFDLNDTLDNVDNIAGSLATIEVSPAITNHDTGEYIMYNNTLFQVTSPIATGENLVLGTNVSPINIGDQLKALQSITTGGATRNATNVRDTAGTWLYWYRCGKIVYINASAELNVNVAAWNEVILFTGLPQSIASLGSFLCVEGKGVQESLIAVSGTNLVISSRNGTASAGNLIKIHHSYIAA